MGNYYPSYLSEWGLIGLSFASQAFGGDVSRKRHKSDTKKFQASACVFEC